MSVSITFLAVTAIIVGAILVFKAIRRGIRVEMENTIEFIDESN